MNKSTLRTLYAATAMTVAGFASSCGLSDPKTTNVLTDDMIVTTDSAENEVRVAFVTRDSLTQHVDTTEYKVSPIALIDEDDVSVNYTARYNSVLNEEEHGLLTAASEKEGKAIHVTSSLRVSEAERNLMVFKDAWQERSQNAALVKAAEEMQKRTGDLLVKTRDYNNGQAGKGEKLANMLLVRVTPN